jgi:hypothetical protein
MTNLKITAKTTPATLATLATHPNYKVRMIVAGHTNTARVTLERLIKDKSKRVQVVAQATLDHRSMITNSPLKVTSIVPATATNLTFPLIMVVIILILLAIIGCGVVR